MTIFKSARIGKDLDFIRNISEKIDRKLSQSDVSKIDNMTVEELQDLNKITKLANFMLTKYENKKDVFSILQYFVSIIHDSSESLEKVDDEVTELIISAEDYIGKIKEAHTRISEKYDIEDPGKLYDEFEFLGNSVHCNKKDEHENSSKNLTKFAIEINSQEYQQNSTKRNVQVI